MNTSEYKTAHVSVTFLSEKEGGRSTTILSSQYRPHFRVHDTDELLGIQFLETAGIPVVPNEGIETLVRLVYYPLVRYEKLEPGVKFDIMEGSKIVGYGYVIEI